MPISQTELKPNSCLGSEVLQEVMGFFCICFKDGRKIQIYRKCKMDWTENAEITLTVKSFTFRFLENAEKIKGQKILTASQTWTAILLIAFKYIFSNGQPKPKDGIVLVLMELGSGIP